MITRMRGDGCVKGRPLGMLRLTYVCRLKVFLEEENAWMNGRKKVAHW